MHRKKKLKIFFRSKNKAGFEQITKTDRFDKKFNFFPKHIRDKTPRKSCVQIIVKLTYVNVPRHYLVFLGNYIYNKYDFSKRQKETSKK